MVDAIDECGRYQELFTMLRGERPDFPHRIFITSRKVVDMQRLYHSLEATALVSSVEIPEQNSIGDIERYISSRIEFFPMDNAADKQELRRNVLRRCNTSFL